MVIPRRHELTDEEWALLEPLLPPPRGHGRPYQDHRRILNGILFVLHTGVPWRDLPERYGPWQTVCSRLRRWTARGLWEQLLGQLQTRLAEEDRIAWTNRPRQTFWVPHDQVTEGTAGSCGCATADHPHQSA